MNYSPELETILIALQWANGSTNCVCVYHGILLKDRKEQTIIYTIWIHLKGIIHNENKAISKGYTLLQTSENM